MPQIYRRTHIQKKGFNKVAKQLLQERLFSRNTYGGAAFKYTKLVCWNKICFKETRTSTSWIKTSLGITHLIRTQIFRKTNIFLTPWHASLLKRKSNTDVFLWILQKILRIPFLQNISRRMLLECRTFQVIFNHKNVENPYKGWVSEAALQRCS